LRSQLALTNLGDRDRVFVQLLIDALDEDGYLTQPLEEIAALLPAEAEAAFEELGIALRHLQNLEPAGVGARSPGECLALQLRIMPDEPARRLALDIVEKHLELLASRDYTRLKNITGAGEEALRRAQRLIQALNPRPGAAYAKVEDALRDSRRHRAQAAQRLAREPQSRRHAAPAHQPPVRRARGGSTQQRRRHRLPAAGSALADQEILEQKRSTPCCSRIRRGQSEVAISGTRHSATSRREMACAASTMRLRTRQRWCRSGCPPCTVFSSISQRASCSWEAMAAPLLRAPAASSRTGG